VPRTGSWGAAVACLPRSGSSSCPENGYVTHQGGAVSNRRRGAESARSCRAHAVSPRTPGPMAPPASHEGVARMAARSVEQPAGRAIGACLGATKGRYQSNPTPHSPPGVPCPTTAMQGQGDNRGATDCKPAGMPIFDETKAACHDAIAVRV